MKNSRKKMLLSSAIMLLVAVIALTSTTFAWFTKSNTAQLTGVNFTAETAGGVDMSFDAVSWTSSLTGANFPSTVSDNGLIATGTYGRISGITNMKPVSCTGAVSSGALSLFSGTVNDNKTEITAAAATTTNNGFYCFNLYFRNTGNKAQEIYLDLSNVSGSTFSSNVSVESGKTSTGIEYATRLAFIVNGSKTESTANLDATRAALEGTSAKIWEPNADTHTAYAIANRGVSAGTVVPSYNAMKTTGVYEYDGAIAVAKAGAGQTAEVSGHLQTNETASTSASADYKITEVPALSITKVTVYVWIEGQDADCNNAESSGSVSTSLYFYGKEKA